MTGRIRLMIRETLSSMRKITPLVSRGRPKSRKAAAVGGFSANC
jgi:hypothetical protein